MAEEADDVVKDCPDYVEEYHSRHQGEKDSVLPFGKKIVKRLPGDQGEGKIDKGNADGAAYVQGKEPFVAAEIAQEDS